jgi:methionyl-tRNA formyltransferase
MRSVVVLGNIPLGTRIIKLLEANPNATVNGVVCRGETFSFDHHAFADEPEVYEYARDRDIDVFELDQLATAFSDGEVYLGVSARYNQVLRERHLDIFQKGVVNCHGGILPAYRGLNCANFALIEDCDEFGGTIHYMTEEVDAGPIIDRAWFDVEDDATAHDVFVEVEESLYDLLDRNIDAILDDTEETTEQETLIEEGEPVGYYPRGELDKYREVSLEWSPERIDRFARAFKFPGYEPAYFEYDDRRVYLTLDWED